TGALQGVGNVVCYSQLLTYKWGPDIKPPSYVPQGDLAESWTQPADLTYVFKLRPGVKFHNVPPVNGRALVAEDVVRSLQRILDLKARTPALAASLAGIRTFEAVDGATVKVALDRPNADLLLNLADPKMLIIARELADQDLTGSPVIGTGAWIFERFEPQQPFTAVRHPEYFLKGLPD